MLQANHCENPQLPHEMCTLAQDRKAWSVWRSTVGTTRNPHERLSQAESRGGGGAKARIYKYFFCSNNLNCDPFYEGTSIYMVYRYMTRDFKGKTLIM